MNLQQVLMVPVPLVVFCCAPQTPFCVPVRSGMGQFQVLVSYPGPSVIYYPCLSYHLHVQFQTPLVTLP